MVYRAAVFSAFLYNSTTGYSKNRRGSTLQMSPIHWQCRPSKNSAFPRLLFQHWSCSFSWLQRLRHIIHAADTSSWRSRSTRIFLMRRNYWDWENNSRMFLKPPHQMSNQREAAVRVMRQKLLEQKDEVRVDGPQRPPPNHWFYSRGSLLEVNCEKDGERDWCDGATHWLESRLSFHLQPTEPTR